MYWRDYYPTHAAALEAGRLGDLGKIKLNPAQKAAVQAARADAKVAAVKQKAAISEARRANKLAKVVNKGRVADARAASKIAILAAKGQDAANSVAVVPSLPSGVSTALLPSFESGAASFAPSGSGGGASFAPADPGAVAPVNDGTIFGLPPLAIAAAAGLVLLLLMKR